MYNEYMKYGLEFFIIIFPVCIAISYLLMWLWTKENKEEVKDFILFKVDYEKKDLMIQN